MCTHEIYKHEWPHTLRGLDVYVCAQFASPFTSNTFNANPTFSGVFERLWLQATENENIGAKEPQLERHPSRQHINNESAPLKWMITSTSF